MYIKYNNNLAINKILLSSKNINSLTLSKKMILEIGLWKAEVDIEVIETMPSNELYINPKLFPNFSIPTNIEYQLKIDERALHIGPVIAFAAVTRCTDLTPETLDKLKVFYINYNQIKGLVYVCAADSFNTTNKTVEGYYLNMSGEWVHGIFPYPKAIYRRTGFSKQLYDDITSNLGNNFFNSYFFNKWEMWEWLSNSKKLKEHLPYTKKLNNVYALYDMVDSYNTVYLKKVFDHKARGIVKVEKTNELYKFIYRLQEPIVCVSNEDVQKFIESINTDKNYIIQQSIETKKYEDRTFDFRFIFQKDGTRQWCCTGIIARFGKKDSIATNFLLAGYALTFEEALKRVFNLSEREIFVKKQEAIDICNSACEFLDQHAGNYGDLGIDIIIDKNLKIWILEINKLHDLKYPLYALNDTQMYYSAVSKPFEYAKSLAGF